MRSSILGLLAGLCATLPAAPLPIATTGTSPQWTLADTLIPSGAPTRMVDSAPGSSSQDRTAAGPLGGTYRGVASVSAQPSSFGLSTSLSLTGYGQGSYVDNYLSNWLPIAVSASARLDDTLVIVGPSPTYTIQLTWLISGAVTTDNASQLTSDVRLVAGAGTARQSRRWFNQDDLTLSGQIVTLLLTGVPSNTPFEFFYTAILATWVDDCVSDTNGAYSCQSPPVYSGTMSAAFGSTFTLNDFAILDGSGNPATSAAYRSVRGYTYPGDSAQVPEPAGALLTLSGIGALVLLRKIG
jgi:hypothetical protein